jgi:DHA1 family multidrug resistance protein-like MFS transporter
MRRHSLLQTGLLFIYSLAGTGMLGHGLLRPVLPIFARRLGATGLEVGLLTSGFMVARALTAYIVGRHVDKTGHTNRFVRIGFFFVFVTVLAFSIINTWEGLLILRFCQGVCFGLIWPTTQVMITDLTKKQFRARALSLYQITGRLGALLSRILFSVVLMITSGMGFTETGSFRVVFLVGSAILLLGFIEAVFMPETPRSVVQQAKRKPPYPVFVLGFIFGALLSLAPLSIVFLNEHFRVDLLGIAFILLGLDIISICAMYIASHFSDRMGVRGSLWAIIIPCFIAALCLPFASQLAIFLIFYFILRAAISSFIPISRAYATSGYTGVGANIGFLNMTTNLGSVLGPVIGGLVYDHFTHGFRIAGYSAVALLLVPAALVLILPRFIRISKQKK